MPPRRPLQPGQAPHPFQTARDTHQLTLAQVAKRAGCSVSTVSIVEAGYVPPLNTRERLAAALGASAGSFWQAVT